MITFHPGAQSSFAAAAEELLKEVKSYASEQPPIRRGFDIHPRVVLTEADIIGDPKIVDREVNGLGEETGRFWNFNGQRFGWIGESYQRLKRLAEKIAKSKEIQNLVSESFILDEIFTWLCETLERKRSDSISDFISVRCDEVIDDHEIYVPLCRTYSSVDFTIGDVEFKSVSKTLLDIWFAKKPSGDQAMEQRFKTFENDTRATFQATLAACIKVRGEKTAATKYALEKALSAVALLRFLSKANWTSKIRSFALPLGMEKSAGWHAFHMHDGAIRELSSLSINEGPHEWAIDESRATMPNLLESLSELAQSQESEFRKTLFESMLIYSRNTTTIDPADKLVFILVALESMLLRDASEPIQGNLGERMAFLIGKSLEERKDVVSVVKKTYAMRSKFIHHGQGIDDLELFDRFLLYAWVTFSNLLGARTNFKTRLELLSKLDELKLS